MSAFKRINHTLKCIWHEFVIRINKKNYLSGGWLKSIVLDVTRTQKSTNQRREAVIRHS